MNTVKTLLGGLLLLVGSYRMASAQPLPFQYTNITQEPVSTAVVPGGQASFTTVVVLRNFTNGANSPTYQVAYTWLYNSDPNSLKYQELDTVVGTGTITVPPLAPEPPYPATTATVTLSIPNAQASNAGAYELIYGNDDAGEVSPPNSEYYGYSNAVTLTVSNAPVITSSPQTQGIYGSHSPSITFSVVASGAQPLSYQWNFNGRNISGATNSSLTIAAPNEADLGTYTVTVSNSFGTATASASLFLIGSQDTPAMPPWTFIVFGMLLAVVAGRSLSQRKTT